MAAPPGGELDDFAGRADVERRRLSFVAVRVEESSGQPLFILKEIGRPAYLPVWCAPAEALSLTRAQQRVRCGGSFDDEYNLPYGVLSDVLGQAGVGVVSTSILSLEDGIFFSEVELSNGALVDARPSDSVGLALWAGAPIFATASVMDEVGVTVTEQSDSESGEAGVAAPELEAPAGPQATGRPPLDPSAMSTMELVGVRAEEATNNVFIVLRVVGSGNELLIRTGPAEGAAILQAQNGEVSARPLAHDFFCHVMTAAGIGLRGLCISRCTHRVTACHLVLSTGDSVEIRPGDGIAIALRTSTPVLAYADARVERRAAVRARLERAAKSGNSAILVESAAVAEAMSLADLLEVGDGDVQSRYLIGVLHWLRFQALPPGEDAEALEAAVTMLTQCFIAGVDGLPEQLLTVIAQRACDAAITMFEQARESADLDGLTTTVDLWRRIVSATPADHVNRACVLSNLGLAQRTRFSHTGDLADLDAAVRSGQAAVEAAPSGHPSRSICLSAFRASLQVRFECTGDLADLDAAIQSGRAAVQATPADDPERPMHLSYLGALLQVRFESTGDLADLDAAVEAGRQATTEASSGQRGRAKCLSNLGASLRVRFAAKGDIHDMEEAFEAGTAAVDAVPLDDPDRAGMLANLASTLLTKFERTGALPDLDEAVAAGRAAVQASPSAPREHAAMLSNLSGFLTARYERAGGLQDLDEAIDIGRAADRARPARDRRRGSSLSNLAVALELRYRRAGAAEDLDAAIKSARAAVDATPGGSPDRAVMLSHMSSALEQRFERTGTPADLDAAINAGRAALEASQLGKPFRAALWSNLGSMLRRRFDHTKAAADLDAAVEAGQEALRSVPDDHPDRAMMLSNLGHAHAARFSLNGMTADRQAAWNAYADAAATSTAKPSLRVRAACAGASLVARSDPGRAASLLESAVLLIPEAAPRHLARSDRQYQIGQLAQLAGDACALALADTSSDATANHRATRALQLLEAGRAVLFSQALDTRSDLTELRERHPGIASRFIELRDQLDNYPDISPPAGHLAAATRSSHSVDERRRLAAELTATMHRIRALDGFASFGLPPSASDLLTEAISGPVVSFNVSRHRSDALLLTDGGISSVPLPGLAHQAVIHQVWAFHEALSTITAPGSSVTDVRVAHGTVRATLEWLWDAAAEPVLDALGYRDPPLDGSPWPRIWWAPGGLLGLVPIHAAGHHMDRHDGGAARTVMDRVVSSYTPTIRALRHARQRNPARRPPDRALIVAMPTTPGVAGRLSNVPVEAAMLRGRLPQPTLLIEPDNLPANAGESASLLPTKANVLALLPGCPIAHFSCHGASNPHDPAKSLLLLHDHQSDPLTVASLAPIDLDAAQLAYLSACRTAFTGTVELMDEAIHLTSAFQLAGFPHVVGTMWQIGDAEAARVADAFYAALQGQDGTIDTTVAARALHETIRSLRDEIPEDPWRWAAHLHSGA